MKEHPVRQRVSTLFEGFVKEVRQTTETRDAAALQLRTQNLTLSGESLAFPGTWYYVDGGAGIYEGEVGKIGRYDPLRLTCYLRESPQVPAERNRAFLVFELVITFSADRNEWPVFEMNPSKYDPAGSSAGLRLRILSDFQEQLTALLPLSE